MAPGQYVLVVRKSSDGAEIGRYPVFNRNRVESTEEKRMPRQFLYNGFAVGFSGRIKAPFDEVVESQASSSLGVTGGYSSARVDNFRRHEIFSFAHAHTQASGILSEKSQAFETLVSGVLEGFNLLDMVKADYIVGRLMSRHPVEPPTDGPDEPTITPVGSQYGKIVVAGYELTPVINVRLIQPDLFVHQTLRRDRQEPRTARLLPRLRRRRNSAAARLAGRIYRTRHSRRWPRPGDPGAYRHRSGIRHVALWRVS